MTERRGADAFVVAHKILDWAKQRDLIISLGQGKRDGSLIPFQSVGGHWHQVIGLWTSCYVEIQFQYLKSRNSLDDAQRNELLARLNQVPGINLAQETVNKRPSVRLKTLTDDAVLAKFLQVIDWAFDAIKAKGS